MANIFKPPKNQSFRASELPRQFKNQGHAVSKATQVAGKRIGGALRAEQQRQQKRKDSR